MSYFMLAYLYILPYIILKKYILFLLRSPWVFLLIALLKGAVQITMPCLNLLSKGKADSLHEQSFAER